MAIGDARGGDDVVVEVGIEGGESEEVVIGAAPERRDVMFAQRLADVDVLPRDPVLAGGALDQILQLIGAEQVGMAQAAITAVGPGQLDLALVAAIELATEQMLHVAQDLPGVWLDDRMDVVAHARTLGASHHRREAVWDELYPAEQERILRLLIERIDVAPNGISVTIHAAGIRSLVAELADQEAAALAASEPVLKAAE